MENQQQPQAPAMAARPWFRLASIRSTEIPVAPAAPPPVAPAVPPPVAAPRPPQPAAPPAAERPLFRLGSLLRTPGAAVPPPPQEPIGQAPPQVQTRVPTTPPPTAPTTAPPPPSPRTPLAAAATQQDQQPPSPGQRSPVLAPSPGVRAPSPPATPPPPTSPTVIRPSEPILAPSAAVVRQQPQPTPPTLPPPRTTIVSPPLPPPVTILSPPPAPAPSPRLPSPPLHPEPETKPVVTVVTAQPSRTTQEPTIGLHKDKSNNINGNGGKKKLEMTQLGGQPRGVSPPLPSPTGTPKKPDPAAAVPGKKKSGSTDEVESRMRVLTLAGENMGAYMNWGSGVPRSGMKGQGRHLTQTPTSQSVEKVAVAVAPGSNGGDASTDQHSHSAIKDVKQGPTGASTWKAGAASAKPMAALVNSNVQSVNNSIMFNSSCEQQSPGVHITLSSGSRRPSSHRLSAGDSNGSTGGDANH